jgi:E3 ubiquitin-protein ligase RNF5
MQGCPPSCRHGASRCRLRLTPAGLDPQVIPIYGRGGNEDPRSKTKGELETVPQRPSGQRPAPVVRNPLLQPAVNVNTQQGGLGIIPTLFGLPGPNHNGGYAEPLTPEQQHQAFLSRLLLMLGSFVIMCLLLF